MKVEVLIKMNGMDYSNDPRSVLCHFNDKHDNLGRFAKKSGATHLSAIQQVEQDVNSYAYGGSNLSNLLEFNEAFNIKTRPYAAKPFTDYIWSCYGLVPENQYDEKEAVERIKKMANIYTSEWAIKSSKTLQDLIGFDKYHNATDYTTATMRIWATVETDLAKNMIEAGLIDAEDAAKSTEGLLPESIRKELIGYIGERLQGRYRNQPHTATEHARDAAREKQVSDQTAKVKRRATSAEEAYRLASEQRYKDMNKKMAHIDYSGDLRSVLCHFNKNHDPDNGQFTTSRGSRFKSSKGIRLISGKRDRDEKRRSNEDSETMWTGMDKYVRNGELTEAGKRRLELDLQRNNQKKKDDRVKPSEGKTVESILTDPHRWVREDLNAIDDTLRGASKMTSDLGSLLQRSESKKEKKRLKKLNVSKMTDAELNAAINRYTLEQRYLDIFDPKVQEPASKGKQFMMNALEVGGGVLAVGASAVTIAKAIHELRK